MLFIKTKVFVVNWFQWHKKIATPFRRALYNKQKCKKRTVPFLCSSQFQTELKEVFEGSCQLIPIKIIANECIKLADQVAML
jgi:hypothetical protein